MGYSSLIKEGLQAYEENGKDSITASFVFLLQNKIFEGHFPDNPILPGIAQLEILKYLIERTLGIQCSLLQADKIKFFRPILPNQRFTFTVEYFQNDENIIEVKCKGLEDNNTKTTEITARYINHDAKKEK